MSIMFYNLLLMATVATALLLYGLPTMLSKMSSRVECRRERSRGFISRWFPCFLWNAISSRIGRA